MSMSDAQGKAELVGGPLDGLAIAQPEDVTWLCLECGEPIEIAKSHGLLSKEGKWNGFLHMPCATPYYAKQGFQFRGTDSAA